MTTIEQEEKRFRLLAKLFRNKCKRAIIRDIRWMVDETDYSYYQLQLRTSTLKRSKLIWRTQDHCSTLLSVIMQANSFLEFKLNGKVQ